MRRHSKASPAGSTKRRNRVGGALATLALAAYLLGLAAAPASAAPPKVTVPNVSNVSYGSAHVSAEVQTNVFVIWTFQVSTDGVSWSDNLSGAAFSTGEVSGDLSGLKGGTTYFVRLQANNFNDGIVTSAEPNPEFTTLPVEPPSVVSVDNAENVRWSLADVGGEVHRPANADPAFDAQCAFQYVTDDQFTASGFEGASSVPCEPNPVTTAGDSAVTAGLSGLTPNTTYHLRLRVENAGGSDAEEAPSTFTTKAADPPSVVATDDASEVGYTTAKATGKVERPAGEDPALDANCRFEYVTDDQFTATGFENAGQVGCEPENPVQAEGETSVSANLAGLTSNTTYHLRLTASNAGGSDSQEAASTFTTQAVSAPVVAADDASAVTGTTAHFSGTVTAGGTDPAFDAQCRFEYVSDADFQIEGFTDPQKVDCSTNPVTGTGPTAVSADVTGLKPHTVYHLRLKATNQGGSTVDNAANFTTESIAPIITGTAAHEIEETSALLTAQINPGGAATTYHFEYISSADYVAAGKQFTGAISTPESASVGEDNAKYPAEAAISGLSADTSYRFRVVATNFKSAPGGTLGPTREFRTAAVATPEGCSNAAVRAQQESTFLPNCRAYEIVSPLHKDSSAVQSQYGIAKADGTRVLYSVFGPIEKARRGLQEYAVSQRGPNGWTTENPLPEGNPTGDRLFTNFHTPYFLTPNPDLDRFVFGTYGSRSNEIPNNNALSGALYRTAPGDTLEWVTRPAIPNPVPAPGEAELHNFQNVGAAPDLSTVYFWSPVSLTPETSPPTGHWELFEFTEGVVKSASVLPDGSQPAYGAAPANTGDESSRQGFAGLVVSPEVLRGQVSRDGKTLLFISPDNPLSEPAPEPVELYIRRDGQSRLVSQAEDGSPAPTGVVPVGSRDPVSPGNPNDFSFGSPDGKIVIFQTRDALTADAPSGFSVKSYRYDYDTDSVSYLPGVDGSTVVRSSDDGSRFLFTDGAHISVWDNGTIKPISTLTGFNAGVTSARTDASGSVFVFATELPIDGANTRGPDIEGPSGPLPQYMKQIFRYDLAKEETICISCPQDDVVPSADVGRLAYPRSPMVANRLSTEDARRIFFDSPDPLLPEDTNGKRDVYQWEDGRLSLLTSGKGETDAFYMDSSASGDDVFIVTQDGLVPSDGDAVSDIYDVKVGGGFLEETVTPCSGEACRGPASEKPARVGSATSSFSGPGNGKPTGKGAGGAKVKVGARRLAGSSLKLAVSAPGAGRVTVTGSGLRKTSKTYPKAGTKQLKVPLSAASKKALAKGRKVTLKVRVRFKPKAKGRASTVNFVLTVKA